MESKGNGYAILEAYLGLHTAVGGPCPGDMTDREREWYHAMATAHEKLADVILSALGKSYG